MMFLLIGCICLILFVVWAWHVPIPDGFSAPFSLRLMLIKYKLKYFYSEILERFGLQTRLEERRLVTQNFLANMSKVNTQGLEVKEMEFDGVKVLIYTPLTKPVHWKGFPALVYIHGGGWVHGHVDMLHSAYADMCKATDTVIVAVAYRFAPENPFPVPFEDCLKATKYFITHAGDFNVNPERIAVGGASAGGNLTAAIMLKLRDDKFCPMPKRQILVYPCLQALDFNTPSMIQNASGPLLTRYIMAWYWSMYISGSDKYTKAFLKGSHTSKAVKEKMAKGNINHVDIGMEFLYKPYKKPNIDKMPCDDKTWEELRSVLMNPYCAPLTADDFSRLPPALVLTCNYDVLRDDGLLYAKCLQDAGVKVTSKLMASGFHGLQIRPHLKEGRDLLNYMNDDIKANL